MLEEDGVQRNREERGKRRRDLERVNERKKKQSDVTSPRGPSVASSAPEFRAKEEERGTKTRREKNHRGRSLEPAAVDAQFSERGPTVRL